MKGYSKIKSLPTESSSDHFLSSSQTPQKINQSKEIKTHETPSETENIGDAYTEKRSSGVGAPKIHRNSSVSSSSSSSKSSAVKRAFSIRRSSSVSERYCRIHDQHVVLSSPPDGEEFESIIKEKKSGNGRTRILKSCKRIFGL